LFLAEEVEPEIKILTALPTVSLQRTRKQKAARREPGGFSMF